MENFIIESSNKKIQVNGVELNLLFDDNSFAEKMLSLSEAIDNVIETKDIKEINKLSKSIDDPGQCNKTRGKKKNKTEVT